MAATNMRNMMIMAMRGDGNNSSGSNSSSSSMSNMQNMILNSSRGNDHINIVNMTAYQTAEVLADQALETFDKYLKPITPSNATATINKIDKDLT